MMNPLVSTLLIPLLISRKSPLRLSYRPSELGYLFRSPEQEDDDDSQYEENLERIAYHVFTPTHPTSTSCVLLVSIET